MLEYRPNFRMIDEVSMSFYEIVELMNGDVALQRLDDETNEPLVTIRFSEETLAFLGEAKFDVAKAMIEAGMETAGDVADQQSQGLLNDLTDDLSDDIGEYEKLMLH